MKSLRQTMTLLTLIMAAGLCSARPGTASAGERPYTPADIHQLKAVSDPQLSPDGTMVAYVVTTTDVAENRKNADIWLVPAAGGEARQLTHHHGSDKSPRWSPDGKTLAFLSTRHGGKPQVHLLPLAGGEAKRITDVHGGTGNLWWAPNGTSLLFTARVYPDCPDLPCTAERDREKQDRQVTARVHHTLLYRHWNRYEDGKAAHLFLVSTDGGPAVDLTPDLQYDALTHWLASAGREFDFSPDGSWLYFAGNQDDNRALSYDMNIWRVPVAGGAVQQITTSPAADTLPRLSPDGRLLAWRATARPGYESDQYDLVVMDLETRETRTLTAGFDYSVGRLFWDRSGEAILFEAEQQGDINLFGVGVGGGEVRLVLGGDGGAGHGYHLDVQQAPDRSFLVYRHRTMTRYYELVRAATRPDKKAADLPQLKGDPHQLTSTNAELYLTRYIPDAESFFYPGADGTPVHGFLARPVGFDPQKRYPLLVRLHGGPQQMFGYAFRHEFAIFAGAGYAVFFCNPRGSTGYGQEFTDQINGDWDGRVVEDIRLGVRHVLRQYPFIDPDRVGAWGGSFGGFLCNWFQGHNEDGMWSVLVSHAGEADQWVSWGCTEELWFPEWESGGPPWADPEQADRWSPIRYAEKFSTPHLITHGDLDWRVHISGGEAMFSALQRRGVPSKMIRFPAEGHWILKPADQQFWLASILDWFDQWLKRDGQPAAAAAADAPPESER